MEVFDGVVDRGGGEERVELARIGDGIVLVEYRLDHGLLGQGFARLDGSAVWLEVVHMETQHIAIFNGMGDGVGVELLFKDVGGGDHAGLLTVDFLIGRVLLEDGRAGEAEQLGLGEELTDGPVVLAELGAVALVEDEDDALVAQGLEAFAIFFLVTAIQCQSELLNGRDDHLVGVIIGAQALHEGFGVGVFLHATRLETVEFLPGLAVEVLAVHHEQAFFDIGIVLEQGGSLERGQRLATSGGVPDVAVAPVLVDAVDDGLNRIDLVGAHHHQLALALDQHHVAAEHLGQGALRQKGVGKFIQVVDLLVILRGEPIDGQKTFVGVETEMLV